MPTTKILITNETALRKKYGASGWADVSRVLDSLVKSDKKRGIRTQIARLDNAADMKSFGGRAVRGMSAKAFKIAFDSVCTSASPDYITIVGAADVVPHQLLRNPLRTPANPDADGDPHVPSDLPYACAAGFNSEPRAFLAPSRVVGRIPDLVGATTPEHLLELLRVAALAVPHPRVDRDYFALSAKVWRGSTRSSLKALFGVSKGLALSPKAGPAWTKKELRPRIHLINCHGAPAAPDFYGQEGKHYPTAHSATILAGKVQSGTVVAAECCYGAELYDPSLAPPMGICHAYLAAGAYGFLGSTTIAYGPFDPPNASADLICRHFLEAVLRGASLGSALLEARQRFIREAGPLDPVDLKTVAQFHLLGDASIHAVKAARSSGTARKSLRGATADSRATAGERRTAFRTVAEDLAVTARAATPGGPPPSPRVRAALLKASSRRGLNVGTVSPFVAAAPPDRQLSHMLRGRKTSAPQPQATNFYVTFARAESQPSESSANISADVVYVAREIDGKVDVRELQQKPGRA